MTEGAGESFGALLRRHRLAAGLTQGRLAERAGVSERAVSDLERGGGRTPRLETVGLLAGGLGLTKEQHATLLATARPGAGTDDAIPETRYARSGSGSIAYQVIGDSPFDLMLTSGFVSNLEVGWEEPSLARFHRRLGAFCRVITYDKRGTGLSDRVAASSPLEERIDDVRAVMDAAGSERAVLMGVSEGGPMSILFAATYPERVTALILYGTWARTAWAPDYPWGRTEADHQKRLEGIERDWGHNVNLAGMAPSRADDARFARWFARHVRLSASPGAAVALARMNYAIDVRHVLPTIRVPTLVLNRTGDRSTVVERGRHLAAQIPGARFVALPGSDHLPFVGDQDTLLDAVQSFLAEPPSPQEPDTVLATVLIIPHADGQSGASPAGGDADAIVAYRALIRANLARFRGRATTDADVMTAATFDGPARAIRCAGAIVDGARALGLAVRVGLHTGEIEVRGDDVGGGEIEFTKGVAERAAPTEILVSSTVTDLVAGSGIRFVDRGMHALANYPGDWHLLAAERESVR